MEISLWWRPFLEKLIFAQLSMKSVLPWIPEFNYRVHKRMQLVHTLTQSSSFPSIPLKSLESFSPLKSSTKLMYAIISHCANYASWYSHPYCGFFLVPSNEHSPPVSSEVKNEWRQTSNSPYAFVLCTRQVQPHAWVVYSNLPQPLSKFSLVSIYFHILWDARNRRSYNSPVKSFKLNAFVKAGT